MVVTALTTDEKQNVTDNMLVKKFRQTAFTSLPISSGLEAEGSSALKIPSKNVWTEIIPSTAPIKTTLFTWVLNVTTGNYEHTDTTGQKINVVNGATGEKIITNAGSYITKTLLGGTSSTSPLNKPNARGRYGNKYVHSLNKQVAFYEYVVLSSTTGYVAYRYTNTLTEGFLATIGDGVLITSTTEKNSVGNTNVLQPGIPSNYDPVGSTYKVIVYSDTGEGTIPSVTNDADNTNWPWSYDPTSGYLTFLTTDGTNGYNLSAAAPASVGGAAAFTPSISFWRYEGISLEKKLFNLDTAIAAAGTGGGGGGGVSVESDPSFNKYIVNPPPAVTFPTAYTSTASSIFIPWEPPIQIELGALNIWAPFITGISLSWTAIISGVSKNKSFIDNVDTYIPYTLAAPKALNGNSNFIKGIVLTKIAPSGVTTPNISVVKNDLVWIGDTAPYKRPYVSVYDPDFANMNSTSAQNYITIWYSNYNKTGPSMKNDIYFTKFAVPGFPMKPSTPTQTMTAAAASAPISTWTLTNLATNWTDNDNNNNDYPLNRWYYLWNSTSTPLYRYITTATPLAVDSGYKLSSSASIATPLYPETYYAVSVQIGNSSSNASTVNQVPSNETGMSAKCDASLTFITPSLLAKKGLSAPTFTFTGAGSELTDYSSCKLVSGGTKSTTANTFFNSVVSTMTAFLTTSQGIHNLKTRGTTFNSGNLLRVVCAVTGTKGTDLGISVNYTGYPASSSSPTGAGLTSPSGAMVYNPSGVTDSYSGTNTGASTYGYYLDTGSTSTITLDPIKGTSRLFPTSSNGTDITTITLSYNQYGNDSDSAPAATPTLVTGTTSSATYSYYYDLSPCTHSTPTWADVSFTAVLRPTSTSALSKQVCGIHGLYGTLGVTTTTTFKYNALGKYFYNNGSFIVYSNNGTNVSESSLANVTTASVVTNGYFPATTIFTNDGTNFPIIYTASTSAFSNSFYVDIKSFTNCYGITLATASNYSQPFYGIWDPLSTDATNFPTSIQSSENPAGCRVATGTSDGTYPSVTTINAAGVALDTTPYPNTAILSDTGNYDLQLANGVYATPSANSKGYLDYTLTIYKNPTICAQNANINYSALTNLTGYRYATFAWIMPIASQRTGVTFTITDFISSPGINTESLQTGPFTGTSETTSPSSNKVTMQYRVQNGNPDLFAITQGNKTSIWCNAFIGIPSDTPAGGAAIVDPTLNGQINADNGSKLNTLVGNVLKVYSVLAGTPTPAAISGVGSYYLYCRIGLPMACNISFKCINAEFTNT